MQKRLETMGVAFGAWLFSKDPFNEKNPAASLDRDLEYYEIRMCHTSKNGSLYHNVWMIYGFLFGLICIPFYPKHWSTSKKVFPMLGGGICGVVADQWSIYKICEVSAKIPFLSQQACWKILENSKSVVFF